MTYFFYPPLKFDFFRFLGSNQSWKSCDSIALIAFFTWFIVLFEQIESVHTGGSVYGQASMLLVTQTVGFRGRQFCSTISRVSIVRAKRC